MIDETQLARRCTYLDPTLSVELSASASV